MSRMNVEIKLKRRSLRSVNKVLVVAALLSVALLTTLFAQQETFSNGLGPRFSVLPAIIFADSQGTITTLKLEPTVPNMRYSLSFDQGVSSLCDEKVLEGNYVGLSLALHGDYSYIRIKGWQAGKEWESSSATLLVLSKNFTVKGPVSVNLLSNNKGRVLYVVLTPQYGREELVLRVNGEVWMRKKLDPYEDSPLIFAEKLNSTMLNVQSVNAELKTISGIVEVQGKTFHRVETHSYYPNVTEFSLSRYVYPPKKVKIDAFVGFLNPSNVAEVRMGGLVAQLENGKWHVQLQKDFTNREGNEILQLPLQVKTINGQSVALTVATTVYVDSQHPIFDVFLESGNEKIPLNVPSRTLQAYVFPASYNLVVKSKESKKIPLRFEVFVDGQSIGTFENIVEKRITLNAGNHVIEVKAVDEINGLSTTKKTTINLKNSLMIPQWTFVAVIIASLIMSLFLIFNYY